MNVHLPSPLCRAAGPLATVAARRPIVLISGSIALLLLVAGCGSKRPVVSGQVTMDGRPLPAATVIFMPANESASPAQGVTDATGKYTLEQEAEIEGVEAGTYRVRISTYQPGSPQADPPVAAIRETVPIRYNLESELQAVVEADDGAKPFDFDLKSGGPIFQPAPDPF